ncbi:MAG: OmpH family outer membrane protein [Candidatus Eremiobacteraeota bacterium]|nr:OmpH family outer membrane protein [Candidatus Eremiobacteraeota bacterium]
MRSASKALALVLTLASAGALSACARVDVSAPQIRGIGYIRLDEIVKRHPLYSQLAGIDDAIAAINIGALGPHVPLSAAQIASQTKALNGQLKDAQTRANKILAQKQGDFARKEQAAVAAALSAAGQGNAGTNVGAEMSRTSAQQAQAAAGAANQEFMAYQQSVIAQDNAAIASVERELQAQAGAKFQARAEAAQQRESTLSLKLSQADASQRLAAKTRLSNLAMDDATRKDLRAQIAALDKKEADALAILRNQDQADLAAYRKTLQDETAAGVRTQAAKIQGQTRAKLESRRNEVTSQLRSLAPAQVPANLSPALQTKLQQIHQQFQTQFQADAQQTVDQYNQTKADLDRQFAALHGAEVGATGAAAKQLADLQKQRSDLYGRIVAQIQSEASRIAKDRGLKVVFDNVEAAAGGYDLTNEVSKDVESLHE